MKSRPIKELVRSTQEHTARPTNRIPSDVRRFLALMVTFMLIISSILVVRGAAVKESKYTDGVVAQLEQEMAENRFVISSSVGRRTVAEFKDPIILTHGGQTRLIVYTAKLEEKISLSSEGWGGWAWTSAYQDVVYSGTAQYTVDLSVLSEEDFILNNDQKILSVRIPYAQLDPINIPADQIRFHDVKKGWAAPRDIKLTAEESAQLEIQVEEKMKSKLIDDDVISAANENAKAVVAELLTATVRSIDPEFNVIVVQ